MASDSAFDDPRSAVPNFARDKRFLRDSVYRLLRSRILDQQLVWGQELIETVLATELGVSRTPIREGIRQLEAEGLVVRSSSGGVRVRQFTPRDIREIYDVLIPLYRQAAWLAAQHYDPLTGPRFEWLIVRTRDSRDPSELHELHNDFHKLVLHLSGNEWLRQALHNLREYTGVFRRSLQYDEPRALAASAEHERIYQHIREQNPAAAATAMEQHISRMRDAVVLMLQRHEDDAAGTTEAA